MYYIHSSYIYNEYICENWENRNDPWNFVISLLALRCRVRKKKCVYQALSLSLSLSLSSVGEESERRGRRELALGRVQPPRLSSSTTRATTCYHIRRHYTMRSFRQAPRAGPAGNSSKFLVHNMIIIYYYKLHFSYINNVRCALLGAARGVCRKLLKFSCT